MLWVTCISSKLPWHGVYRTGGPSSLKYLLFWAQGLGVCHPVYIGLALQTSELILYTYKSSLLNDMTLADLSSLPRFKRIVLRFRCICDCAAGVRQESGVGPVWLSIKLLQACVLDKNKIALVSWDLALHIKEVPHWVNLQDNLPLLRCLSLT